VKAVAPKPERRRRAVSAAASHGWNYNCNVFDGFFDSEYSDQNTQTRDTMALQLKLDELIIATKGVRNEIVGIEDAADEEISEEKKKNKRRSND
jgi:hypothetical protein